MLRRVPLVVLLLPLLLLLLLLLWCQLLTRDIPAAAAANADAG